MYWFDFQIGVWFCEWLLGSKGIGNKIDMRSMGRRRSELDYKELKICEHVLIGFILICLAQVSLGATNLQDGKGQPSFICWLLFSIEILISLLVQVSLHVFVVYEVMNTCYLHLLFSCCNQQLTCCARHACSSWVDFCWRRPLWGSMARGSVQW